MSIRLSFQSMRAEKKSSKKGRTFIHITSMQCLSSFYMEMVISFYCYDYDGYHLRGDGF